MKDADTLNIRDAEGGAIIAVKVVAGSSRDRIVGVLAQALKIATTAPAEKGKANAAVARILAKALSVDVRGVQLISGRTSQRKEFLVPERTAGEIRHLLERA